MHSLRSSALALVTLLAFGPLGCELITAVDENKIPKDTPTTTSSSSGGGSGPTTTSSSTGGGMGGAPTTSSSSAGGAGGSTSSGGGMGGSTSSGGGMGGSTSSGGGMGGSASSGGGMGGSTSSGGGMGGAATTGAGGNGGMGGGGCGSPADCPPPANECVVATCNAGVCGTSFVAAGTATMSQKTGDCKQSQCDGAGTIVDANDDADLPDDKNPCTDDVCTNGVATNPPVSAGTSCGANEQCDGNGACVGCLTANDCPGVDDTCKQRTCTLGMCGVQFAAAGTQLPAGSQTSGDCKVQQCDGSGNAVAAPDDADVPVDGKACTSDVCTSGVPSNPPAASGTACNENGGSVCDGGGTCVQCVSAATCPGQDTECQTRTCNANACGVSFAAQGTPVASQTSGDCLANVCNGSGGVTAVADDADVPADDGNACTGEICVAGAPSHPALPAGTACNQNGGSLCDGGGACVQCLVASDCPGVDDDCQMRTCNGGLCGVSYAAAGTLTSSQTAGDCNQSQCDGSGNVVSVVDDTDVPVDGEQCTGDVCTNGTPSNPPLPADTACNENGGSYCSAAGTCVQCNDGSQCASLVCSGGVCQAASCNDGVKNGDETGVDCGGLTCGACPAIQSTTPADGASGVGIGSPFAITFNVAVDPATLTAQTAPGACTGSVQVSTDGFATCIGFAKAAPTMSGSNKIATFVPAPALSYGSTYAFKIAGVADTKGNVASSLASATGFATGALGAAAPACDDRSVVISQVYGAGGNSNALYNHDFVELHNRGSVAVSIDGWSLQYTSKTGTSWGNSMTVLSGTIPPGGYFLVQESGGATGAALPTPDATGSLNFSGTDGKIALVSSSVALSAAACPSGAFVVDSLGYGSTDCAEGTHTASLSATTSAQRNGAGCTDTGNNASDFTLAAPNPRNSAKAAAQCAACDSGVTLNESGAALEADYCVIQSPQTDLTVQTGATTEVIYGQLYESGVTPAGGANASIVAQLGYGPSTANPEDQPGWVWTTATYNTSYGNNDEYQATITAPAAGSYRYGYRFSLDGGATWTYCDVSGAGSNDGLSFETTKLPALTVTP